MLLLYHFTGFCALDAIFPNARWTHPKVFVTVLEIPIFQNELPGILHFHIPNDFILSFSLCLLYDFTTWSICYKLWHTKWVCHFQCIIYNESCKVYNKSEIDMHPYYVILVSLFFHCPFLFSFGINEKYHWTYGILN